MAAISHYYGLNPPFEFLDVDVANDNRLYLDPHAIRIERGPSPYASQARKNMDTFFDEIVGCVLSSSSTNAHRGLNLLQHFNEPKETRLGMSKAGIDGHGGADDVGSWIWAALSTDARALIEVGVFKRIEHLPLFVEGVDKDITSDVTTRIIFEPLARFTQAMMRKYPHFTRGAHKAEPFTRQAWNGNRREWVKKELELPVAVGKPLLLIPRYWARPTLLMRGGRYYDTELLTYVQEQLAIVDRRTGKLIKDPKRELKKKRRYKRGRATNLRVTEEAKADDEDLVDRFRAFVDRKYSRLDDDELRHRLGGGR